ncbi:MAG: apolipoprotein N-acyltransferase [Bacteroidales bacterium]|nr:apolipoprotein N-acyltransferase [Bacteroidales bacterium]
MTKKKLFIIAMTSGLLMCLAWADVMLLSPLTLVAFVPLLWVEDYILHNNENKQFSSGAVFRYTYLPFLLFAFVNTWWIMEATWIALVVPFFEACFMALVFQVYHFAKKVAGNTKGAYFYLPLFWILFEYIQFNWDVNFPWLNLGNSFVSYPFLIQWYSVLGMEGGSLWILLSNIFIYLWLIKKEKYKPFDFEIENSGKRLFRQKQEGVFAILILLLPILWSVYLWYSYKEDNIGKIDVVVVQPNLDPYNEQYSFSPLQVARLTQKLATPLMDDNVDYVLMPESSIQEYAWEEEIDSVESIVVLNRWANRWKKAEIIAGLSSKRMLPKGEKTPAARKLMGSTDEYYESCNIAVDVPRSGSFDDYQIHHKTILTVGVEKMPFKKYLSFVENFALDLGGTIGTLGIDTNTVIFTSKTSGNKVCAAICYESVDVNYIRKFINKGAQAIFIMTNDGWWGDTKGYKHHFSFAKLRAIENRRYIARSANTGISGFINPKGQVIQKTEYWEEDAIKQSIPLQNSLSFFAKHGDIIMKPFSFFAVLLLIYSLVMNKIKKQNKG